MVRHGYVFMQVKEIAAKGRQVMDYAHSDIADGIAATLAAGDNAVADVGRRAYGSKFTVFTVVTDSGQRFTVTVDPVDGE